MNVSAIDPLTGLRLQVPVRGPHCTHIECCDLSYWNEWMDMNIRYSPIIMIPMCPLAMTGCKQRIAINQCAEVDYHYQQLLEASMPNTIDMVYNIEYLPVRIKSRVILPKIEPTDTTVCKSKKTRPKNIITDAHKKIGMLKNRHIRHIQKKKLLPDTNDRKRLIVMLHRFQEGMESMWPNVTYIKT